MKTKERIFCKNCDVEMDPEHGCPICKALPLKLRIIPGPIQEIPEIDRAEFMMNNPWSAFSHRRRDWYYYYAVKGTESNVINYKGYIRCDFSPLEERDVLDWKGLITPLQSEGIINYHAAVKAHREVINEYNEAVKVAKAGKRRMPAEPKELDSEVIKPGNYAAPTNPVFNKLWHALGGGSRILTTAVRRVIHDYQPGVIISLEAWSILLDAFNEMLKNGAFYDEALIPRTSLCEDAQKMIKTCRAAFLDKSDIQKFNRYVLEYIYNEAIGPSIIENPNFFVCETSKDTHILLRKPEADFIKSRREESQRHQEALGIVELSRRGSLGEARPVRRKEPAWMANYGSAGGDD